MKNTLTSLIMLTALLFPTLSLATPGILKMFLAKYPASEGSQLSSCRTCHLPAQENFLNSYALALKENGLDFSLIEMADSDSDTVSNIDEINSKQLPGSQAQEDEVFLFTNRIGAITFNHEKHSLASPYLSKGKCENCHSEDAFPRQFDDNVSWQPIAHPLCKGCHKESGSENAPTKCFICHDKSKKK
ncbi:cytochrome c3 family protein [Thermodesulfobacteriota bacterium]